jgi:hypothetical protein
MIRIMTARDHFTWSLKCPSCGKTGVAQVSQADGWSFVNGHTSTRIDEVPAGFVAVDGEVHCKTCDKVAS